MLGSSSSANSFGKYWRLQIVIREIAIQRFKTIRKAELRLSRFNLFAGMNGMGKSSCIQTRLLLRQSRMLAVVPKPGLILRGPLVDVGRGVDAFHHFRAHRTLSDCYRRRIGELEFDVLDDSEVLPVHAFEHTYASGEQAGDGADATFNCLLSAGDFVTRQRIAFRR